MDGQAKWSCENHQTILSTTEQREGCNDHRYIPILLAKTAKPIDMDRDCVIYEMADGKRFTNGDPAKNPDHLSSQEIHACADKTILVDEQCLEIRKQHGGKFV
jgi:hypothetical protein